MPIYEFYCARCHTIYNFLARSANNKKIPLCPSCTDVPLVRRMSVFSTISSSNTQDATGDDPFAGIDESKVARELEKLAAQAGRIGDDDPRAAAQLMRKFSSMTGMKLGDGFQEALKRMESGEDPEKIAEEMGDALAEEEPWGDKKTGKAKSRRKIRIDETLYEL
jgi:putative FmdB family regulatory protein